MIIEYAEFRTEQNRKLVEKLLKKYSHLIPNWCLEILLQQKPTDESFFTASAIGRSDYGWAVLTFYDSFFAGNKRDQESAMVHELMELHVSKIRSFINNMVAPSLEKLGPEVASYTAELFRQEFEYICQSLSYAILSAQDNGVKSAPKVSTPRAKDKKGISK